MPELHAKEDAAGTVNRRNSYVRRRTADQSQALRSGVQLTFLLLNLWIGVQFYFWVRFYETGGNTWRVSRPPGVEGWLPIASLMNLKAWLWTGEVPQVHPAGLFLLILFLAVSFLLSKSFCSWICPVGTVSEVLWKIGRTVLGRNLKPPKWVDFGLRILKYLLLGLFLFAVARMSVDAIRAFLESPYGLIADVKMLNFFRDLSLFAASIIGALVLLSLVVRNFWCRYLCPYGALMGIASVLGPVRIRRDAAACINCAKCAKACPSFLPIDELLVVRSPECLGCYECVAVCPAKDALGLSMGKRRRVAPALAAAVILGLFLGVVLGARWAGHWETELPDSTYFELVPAADRYSHP